MSWAAKRSTTREEDQAYSFFTIFDVNDRLIYGEGGKAFTRIQGAHKGTNDFSLFAWQSDFRNGTYTSEAYWYDCLANSHTLETPHLVDYLIPTPNLH
jgi:hypothetical protein